MLKVGRGWRDRTDRILTSKASALPLGESPINMVFPARIELATPILSGLYSTAELREYGSTYEWT